MTLRHSFAVMLAFSSSLAFAGQELPTAATCTMGSTINYAAHPTAPTSGIVNLIVSQAVAQFGLDFDGINTFTVTRNQPSLQLGRMNGPNTEWITLVPAGSPPTYFCDWAWVNTGPAHTGSARYGLQTPPLQFNAGTKGYELRYFELVKINGVNQWVLTASAPLKRDTVGVNIAPR